MIVAPSAKTLFKIIAALYQAPEKVCAKECRREEILDQMREARSSCKVIKVPLSSDPQLPVPLAKKEHSVAVGMSLDESHVLILRVYERTRCFVLREQEANQQSIVAFLSLAKRIGLGNLASSGLEIICPNEDFISPLQHANATSMLGVS